MADFPYTMAPGKFPELVDEIRTRGVPPRFQIKWLEAAGFKSKNDRRFIPLLKFLNLIDDSGTTNENYAKLRGPGWRGDLAALAREAYAPIFATLPDAHVRPKEQLIDQFRVEAPGSSSDVVNRMVTTFMAVCDLADFGIDVAPHAEMADGGTAPAPSGPDPLPVVGPPQPQIAVQVNLDPSMNPEQIDEVFKSLAKHIYGKEESG